MNGDMTRTTDRVLLDILHKAQRVLDGIVRGCPPRVRVVYSIHAGGRVSVEYTDRYSGWTPVFVAASTSELLEMLDMSLMDKTWAAIWNGRRRGP